jgi:hypothetical protein
MKSAFLFALGLAISVLLSSAVTVKAATEGTRKFDGNWSVTLDAKVFKNPDGSTAQPFVSHFSATVKDGIFHGEKKTRGKPDFLELNGKIAADGTATLVATGISGDTLHTAMASNSAPSAGLPVNYQVVAHFDNRHGTGHSVGSPPRTRIFTFTKE